MKSLLTLSLAGLALAAAVPAAAQSWYGQSDAYAYAQDRGYGQDRYYGQDRGYDRMPSYDQAIRQIQRGAQEGTLDRRQTASFYRRAQLARDHEMNARSYGNYDAREVQGRYAYLIQQIRDARRNTQARYDRSGYDRDDRGYYGDDRRY